MSVIGSVFNDGLARIGIEDAFEQTGAPSTWRTAGFVKADDFDSAILRGKNAVKRPATGSVTELHVAFSISGLSYKLTVVQVLAMAVLLLHIVIALIHVVWILWKCESSGCWDSVIELIVLAQNSRPALTALADTAAGIKHSSTLAKQIAIRATTVSPEGVADHLEMVYEEEAVNRDRELVLIHNNDNHSLRSEPGISHSSTWPLRRQSTRTPSNGSLAQFPEIDSIPSTPLISAAGLGEMAQVEVGKAYG
ncbi:MAG: hypothetical protein Q9186_005341 [Xanthomendoza sp. 1 TL-2023]